MRTTTPKPDATGYKEYGRIRRNASEFKEFKGKDVHHVEFPRKKFPNESTDSRNLLLTDKETHKDLHRATGGKGAEMYRKKEFAAHEDKGVRDSVKDYFNFQNPKSNVPLDQVKRKLELKKRLEAVPKEAKKLEEVWRRRRLRK